MLQANHMQEAFTEHSLEKDAQIAPEVAAYEKFLRDSDSPGISRRGLLGGGAAAVFAVGAAPLADLAISASPAEAAEGPKEFYERARKLIATTRNAHNVHMVNVFHKGHIVPLGELNTEGYQLVEEDQVDDVLESLGFGDTRAFAQAFNTKFSHRSTVDQDRLLGDAEFVATMREKGLDIRIKNEQFINFRLALMIWVSADTLSGDYSKTFTLGGQTFSTPEVLKVLPTLKGERLARLLLDHETAVHLEAMMKLAKLNIRIPDAARPTIPAFASFVRSVQEVQVGDSDLLQQMSTLYFSTGTYGEPGERFLYSQFIASPMGKKYYAVLERMKNTKLERNNYFGTDVTKDPFSIALETSPEDSEDYNTISRFLGYWGN